MSTVYLILGGNLGNRYRYIKRARTEIEQQVGKVLKVSGIFETEAWGYQDNKRYLNQVLKVDTTLSAVELLEKVLSIEKLIGRRRTGNKFEARTIDIDLLLYNYEIIENEQLTIPHPLMLQRRFVLVPLAEIAPNLKIPGTGKKVVELLALCPDKSEVKPFVLEYFRKVKRHLKGIFSFDSNESISEWSDTRLLKAYNESLSMVYIEELFNRYAGRVYAMNRIKENDEQMAVANTLNDLLKALHGLMKSDTDPIRNLIFQSSLYIDYGMVVPESLHTGITELIYNTRPSGHSVTLRLLREKLKRRMRTASISLFVILILVVLYIILSHQ